MNINYSSLIIKKGFDTENLKELISKFSTNLIIEYEDLNDFKLSHENSFNSFVNLKNKSLVIISDKHTNSDKYKFSFSTTIQEAKDIIQIEEIEREID